MKYMQTFLQTERWGMYQKALGRGVFFVSGDGWKSFLVRHDLPLGKNYLYCPRGPVAAQGAEFPISNSQFPNNISNAVIKEFLDKAAEAARQEKSIFLRWDPPLLGEHHKTPARGEARQGRQTPQNTNYKGSSNSDFQKELQATGYKLAETRSVQPRHTLVVDLTNSEEELLRGMHEKTRYNIRVASRHGVGVRLAGLQDADAFFALLEETAHRDKFSLHPRGHYKKLLEALQENPEKPREPFARLYVALLGERVLAGALVVFYGGTATYLHGASSSSDRNLMAPYLLHWYIMQEAKQMGCGLYDFWGIDRGNPHWAGITRFKQGFGGEELQYPGSVDVVLSALWYGAYRILTRLR